mmetsp:Transcript_6726/g.20405  ORF Transcript_6726/g.20405 Transcript_6726/m.20405 type:complete len:229 (+) Transcript_6726:630-1316(+)
MQLGLRGELGGRGGGLPRPRRPELPGRALEAHSLRRRREGYVQHVPHAFRPVRGRRQPRSLADRHGLRPLQGRVKLDHHVRQGRERGRERGLRVPRLPQQDCRAVQVEVPMRRGQSGRLPHAQLQPAVLPLAVSLRLRPREQAPGRHLRERAGGRRHVVGGLHGLPDLHRLRSPLLSAHARGEHLLDGHLCLHLQLPERRAHRDDLRPRLLRPQSGSGFNHGDVKQDG